MGKLEDMALIVEVAETGGLSAAGRRLSLSPASMTARLKAIEERYQTRLFHRSTRAITLTQAGESFYHAALRVLDEARHAESLLIQREGVLSGNIRISAPSDFGRQYLSPAILDFSRLHPDVNTSLYLGERVVVLSSSPTWVQEDLTIDLPPERDQLTTRALPRFTELRTHVYDQIQRAKRGTAVAPQSAR